MNGIILVFSSVHHALRAEGHLNKTAWDFRLVPVPPHVNEGCGLGVQIEEEVSAQVISYLQEQEILPLKAVKL